ncbi:hypothetical protein HPB48_026813 [Haemaphysalis longicornis]|uniref:Transposable element P transposase-like GTP-binding insertion domain-containing protein n=1 Tax=Haemaphysalis longicornis TaxID=44386 RepID=A0A9J6H236_HAELO|nr:hypothetical protein HPB48_026813 [Haemaphysalis longicornis]
MESLYVALLREIRLRGIHKATCVPHPKETGRGLFISDFPHLVKCVQNGLFSGTYDTPEDVDFEHIRTEHNEDKSAATLKVMPKITAAHMNLNNFERMKVNLAFPLFSLQVLQGLFYKSEIMKHGSDPAPTEAFVLLMWKLIQPMTANVPLEGLKPGSTQESHIKDVLEYLNQ